jgi:hypothetical protein
LQAGGELGVGDAGDDGLDAGDSSWAFCAAELSVLARISAPVAAEDKTAAVPLAAEASASAPFGPGLMSCEFENINYPGSLAD